MTGIFSNTGLTQSKGKRITQDVRDNKRLHDVTVQT